MTYKNQKKILLTTFLFLPVAFMVLFMIVPTVRMVYYSFTNWDGVLKKYDFIWIRNYLDIFSEPLTLKLLKNNLVYGIFGIAQNVIALFLAVLICSKMRAKSFYKTVLFLPYIINITAVAFMFNYLYDFREGPFDVIINALGGNRISFLGNGTLAIFSLAFISFWKWLGLCMVLYIAALNSVSPEIYESGKVDGANSWQTFKFITLPSIIKIVELQMFFAISGAMQAFVEPLIMTKGGPDNSTYTILYYIIDVYTKYSNYGYASALSVLLIIIIIVLSTIQRKVIYRRENL